MDKINAVEINMAFIDCKQDVEHNRVTFVCCISDQTLIKIIEAKKYGAIKMLLPD